MGGFCLLPCFAEMARCGGLASSFVDEPIALLPVLIAHENATTRESYPNLARLAILAGVSKVTAGSG